MGQYDSLDETNRSEVAAAKASNKANNKTINGSATGYDDATFAFVRFEANTTANKGQKLIIVSNFSQTQAKLFSLKLPQSLIAQWQLTDATYPLKDLLEDYTAQLVVEQGEGQVQLQLAPLSSAIFELAH